jgi:chemotaxis protein methyltransferase CheR
MALNSIDFDYVRGIVRQHSAIALDDNKAYLAETRLVALANQEGISSVSELVARLRVDPAHPLRQKVVEAMTTNETSFFRDIHLFDAIQRFLFPELVRSRARTRNLRIWSAACSTGQEPYSLAMLLRDHFSDLQSWQVSIQASDLSTEVLDRARAGKYSQLEVNRGIPAHLLIRYFERHGLYWSVVPNIKQMIQFKVINLIDQWPTMVPMDLIMLRNVLIYFDTESKRRVLDRMAELLAPDGYLILGASETTLFDADVFQRVDLERCCIYRLKRPGLFAGPHLRNWAAPR